MFQTLIGSVTVISDKFCYRNTDNLNYTDIVSTQG